MKTKFFVFCALMCALFSSCSKNEDNEFNYSMDVLYGTWEGIALRADGDDSWLDITEYPYTKFAFDIKFNSDGAYYGSGYFGNGSGTYTAIGNRVTTYVDGEEYFYYDIVSLSGNLAEVLMRQKGSDTTIGIKIEKQ